MAREAEHDEATANPELWTQTPSSVSAGTPLWSCEHGPNRNGPTSTTSASNASRAGRRACALRAEHVLHATGSVIGALGQAKNIDSSGLDSCSSRRTAIPGGAEREHELIERARPATRPSGLPWIRERRDDARLAGRRSASARAFVARLQAVTPAPGPARAALDASRPTRPVRRCSTVKLSHTSSTSSIW